VSPQSENSFDEISSLLQHLQVPIGVAEAHGLLCGLLCSQPSAHAKTRWFTELLGAAEIAPESVASRATYLRSLDGWFGSTLESLNDAELGYMPLLPADDAAIVERVASLSDFCAGFNYGLGIGMGNRGNQALPEDTQELLKDFHAIEATEAQTVQPDDEAAFAELTEYVRVGVLLINEELQPVTRTAGEPSKPRVH